MRRATVIVLLLLSAGSLAFLAPNQTTQDPLTLGVQAYKRAEYEKAIEYFKKAVADDPSNPRACLYLGTAYAQQVVPGIETPENKQNAQQAIACFQRVLDLNATPEQKTSALKGIAALYFNINDLDNAKASQQKLVDADPNDPEAYYTVGVIDWTQTYKPRMEARAALGLEPHDPLIDKAKCAEIRAMNQDKVKEGIEMLAKALELRPDYDDAMAYMNLMYRERADIQCGDPAARETDLKKADDWVNLTLATKKKKSESQRTPAPPK